MSDFTSEYKKYNKGEEGFKEAKDLLASLDESKYHYIIGGEYKEGGEGLTLKIKRYFNVDCVTELNPDEIFEGGMTVNELNQYTKWFTEFKNHNHSSDDSDGSGSAGSGGLSHSFVLAVDENKKTTIIPVNYYVKFSLRNKKAFKPGG
ncbi:hypothetical protein [Citrobacter amalonaticus]|uniref:hypothetical protein n=1 Tax=Citrobacter amalonaticus TaxID=35703 RepID=UPI0011AF15F7|nr:hypothetical protein [Citrobacter amalonaticus]